MEKENIKNPRYPHVIKIVRNFVGKSDIDDPFADEDAPVGEDKEILIYLGEGRSYTNTTTEGDKYVDKTRGRHQFLSDMTNGMLIDILLMAILFMQLLETTQRLVWLRTVNLIIIEQ